MKCLMRRTSQWNDDEPPCDGVRREEYEMWDTRTFKSPEEHDAKFPKDAWHSRGTDHELCSAGIRRKMKDKGWMMDINTLEELEAFATKHDTIIIEATGFMVPVDGVLIEIYDDYRE